jgi:hypothetical protein
MESGEDKEKPKDQRQIESRNGVQERGGNEEGRNTYK